MFTFSTWHQGIEYTAYAHGYYYAYLDLAQQIAEKTGYVPIELEIESKYGVKTLKLGMS